MLRPKKSSNFAEFKYTAPPLFGHALRLVCYTVYNLPSHGGRPAPASIARSRSRFPISVKNRSSLRALLPALSLLALAAPAVASAQSGEQRYFRIQFRDKGTPARVLAPADPLYAQATAHLTPRALARRAKVLPADSLVSTDDLPIPAAYLDGVSATGARIAQSSRWLNSVTVLTDSATALTIQSLPYVQTVAVMRTRRPDFPLPPHGKVAAPGSLGAASAAMVTGSGCLEGHYGQAQTQNHAIGIDLANRRGFAGEGVFVGVLDSGFDWRKVAALRDASIVAEHDFVFNDDYTGSDQPGEPSNPIDPAGGHGTLVTSVIAGYLPDKLIGGASKVTLALARTEDVFREVHLEEDNFVAGLEWLESLGVDVTNTSLGYTTFDFPETGFSYDELTGHTAFASRGLNHAVRLGMACVVAAGNEALSYNYIGVPAEADSSIAVAAANLDGTVTYFSSRGFSEHAVLKPDVAALGVAVFGADARDSSRLTSAQGTSLASPLVTSAAGVLLSAAPELSPFELKDLLKRSAARAASPDTAVGYGVINVARALDTLSRRRPIVGVPQIYLTRDSIHVNAWSQYLGAGATGSARYVALKLTNAVTGASFSLNPAQPVSGIATWSLGMDPAAPSFKPGDSVIAEFTAQADGRHLRATRATLTRTVASPASTLCNDISIPELPPAYLLPVPSEGRMTFGFTLDATSNISLVVYNTAGQEITRLIDDVRMNPGVYETVWNGAGEADGAYFFSLTIDGTTTVQKGVLLHK